jgi:hypothetical protein
MTFVWHEFKADQRPKAADGRQADVERGEGVFATVS